jgi:hypothetical protein
MKKTTNNNDNNQNKKTDHKPNPLNNWCYENNWKQNGLGNCLYKSPKYW